MSKYSDEERRLVKLNTPEGEYRHPEDILGPVYPDLGQTVAKFRRKAVQVGAIREMLPNDRREYGAAVLKAICAKHRTLHMKPNPPTTPGWYSPPSVTRLLCYQDPPRGLYGEPPWKANGHDNWAARSEAVYEAAMKAKRA